MDTQTRSQRILNIGTLHEWATFPLEGTHYEVKISAPSPPPNKRLSPLSLVVHRKSMEASIADDTHTLWLQDTEEIKLETT